MSVNKSDNIVPDDAEWLGYLKKMFPPKPLKGKLLKLLYELIQGEFLFDPLTGEEVDSCDWMDTMSDNVLKFCKMCAKEDDTGAGVAWLNAMHQFGDRKFTPLAYAVHCDPNAWRVVHILLHYGADPNLRDSKGEPPLFKALVNGERYRTFNILMEKGANPAVVCPGGKSIAMYAKELAEGANDMDSITMKWKSIKEKLGIVLPDESW